MADTLRVAWDSCVLIDALQKDPKWFPELRPMYRAALAGRLSILVSEVCVAEVCKLNAISQVGLPIDIAKRKIELFYQQAFVIRRPADRREASMAAALIRDHGLDTCDAIIVATASIHRAAALFTRDGMKVRLHRTAPLSCDCKIGEPPLPIRVPSAVDFERDPIFAAAREVEDESASSEPSGPPQTNRN